MHIRQEIALSLKCQIPVPGFKVSATLEEPELIEIELDPNYEQIEDIFLTYTDNKVSQVYYYDGELKHPLIAIDDPYLLTGRQGGRLQRNLVTMFSGELKLSDRTLSELTKYLSDYQYKGFIELTFSIINNTMYFNRIALSLPEDYTQNILNLYQLDIETYFTQLADNTLTGPQGISCSCRLYAYPYDIENNQLTMDNIPVPGAYPLQYTYAIDHYQERFHIKDAWKELYRKLSDKAYTHNGICFNLDGGYRARKVYDILKRQHLIKY